MMSQLSSQTTTMVTIARPQATPDFGVVWNGAFAQTEADMRRLWDKLRAEWIASFKSQATRRAYTTATEQWLDFLATQTNQVGESVQPWAVDASHVRTWLRLLQEDHSPATANQRLAACSSWYSFVINERHLVDGRERTAFFDADGVTRANPFQANNIARPETVAYREAKPLTLGQMQRVLNTCNKETVNGARNYALLFTAFLTGWRVAELVGMQWGRIRPHRTQAGEFVYEWTGKGAKTANDALPAAAYAAILHYLRLAGRIPAGTLVQPGADSEFIRGHQFVFTPLDDQALGNLDQFRREPTGKRAKGRVEEMDGERHISPQTANRVLRSALKQAGLPVTHRFHDLRHTLAHAHHAAFKDIRATQLLLHHSSPTTTIKYLTSMTDPVDTHSATIVQQMLLAVG